MPAATPDIPQRITNNMIAAPVIICRIAFLIVNPLILRENIGNSDTISIDNANTSIIVVPTNSDWLVAPKYFEAAYV